MDAKTPGDKRARVLSAAESVFLKQGYGPTTMGDLASAAGMSRPALYLVYARKHELFSAIIHEEQRGGARDGIAQAGAESLQHWMTWVCDLWLGEAPRPTDDRLSAPALGHQRSEGAQREAAFLQTILQEGLSRRLPWTREKAVCGALARLLTFCVFGLLESRVDAAQRKALLSVQIDALAEAAMRPDEAPARRTPPARRSNLTASALGAN